MQGIESLKEIIESRISNIDYSKNPIALYEPISYTLSNAGKRIRPLLTLMACDMFSENVEKAVGPALGVEMFHNFTLLHDDIMDNAPVRRGKPTVHVKWNPNTAILSGDTMMVAAYQLISEAPDYCLRNVLEIFSKVAIEVCEGQMYDMEFEDRRIVEVDEYLEMISLKTSVLIGGALKIGAYVGKASEKDAENIYQFGLNLGISFQLLDDWLDVFSDPKVFGKQTGGDIVANKKTYLLIKALEKAEGEQKSELENWLLRDSFDEQEKIEAVKKIYCQLGVDELLIKVAQEYSNKAFDYLDKVNIESEKKQPLKQLGSSLLNRIK